VPTLLMNKIGTFIFRCSSWSSCYSRLLYHSTVTFLKTKSSIKVLCIPANQNSSQITKLRVRLNPFQHSTTNTFALPPRCNNHITEVIGCSVIRNNTGKGNLFSCFAANCAITAGMLHSQPLLCFCTVSCPVSGLQKFHDSVHLHRFDSGNNCKVRHGKISSVLRITPPAVSS